MSGAHLYTSYFPTEDDHPRGRHHESHTALHFTKVASFQQVHLQFSSPSDDALAVRYLRELAAAATDLADQVQKRIEDRTVEAVLSGD